MAFFKSFLIDIIFISIYFVTYKFIDFEFAVIVALGSIMSTLVQQNKKEQNKIKRVTKPLYIQSKTKMRF